MPIGLCRSDRIETDSVRLNHKEERIKLVWVPSARTKSQNKRTDNVAKFADWYFAYRLDQSRFNACSPFNPKLLNLIICIREYQSQITATH